MLQEVILKNDFQPNLELSISLWRNEYPRDILWCTD